MLKRLVFITILFFCISLFFPVSARPMGDGRFKFISSSGPEEWKVRLMPQEDELYTLLQK